MSFIRVLSAKLIVWIHILSMIWLAFGCLLPKPYLVTHIVTIFLVVIQWKLNRNQCVLTQLQHILEGKKPKPDEEGQFIKSLFQKYGVEPTEKQLFLLIYGILGLSGAVSFLKLTYF